MLRTYKERVSRGEARIQKNVVTEQKQVEVSVTREELVIERTNVSGGEPATGNVGEEDIVVPLSKDR
ncbi:MAG TPA: DUF2382 domain-containing protein [Terriglobales bacterium]|nr:DUF2382 domain-containing protein [Terriglobales bacterium]